MKDKINIKGMVIKFVTNPDFPFTTGYNIVYESAEGLSYHMHTENIDKFCKNHVKFLKRLEKGRKCTH